MQYETKEKSFDGCKFTFRNEYGREIKITSNEKEYKRYFTDSFYYSGFMEEYICRRNCYDCVYATRDRVGDITLGDFWGLGKEVEFDGECKYGVNVVLVNDQKGIDAFEKVKSDICYWERTLEEAIHGNARLRHPADFSKYSKRFMVLSKKYKYKKLGNAKAAARCNRKQWFVINVRDLLNRNLRVKRILKTILNKD